MSDYRPIVREDVAPEPQDEPAPVEAAEYVPIVRDEAPEAQPRKAAKKTVAKKAAPGRFAGIDTSGPTTEESTPAQPAQNEESA